jgi:hypothetical protein
MTIATIFLIAALILFILDAIGISSRVNLQSAGWPVSLPRCLLERSIGK